MTDLCCQVNTKKYMGEKQPRLKLTSIDILKKGANQKISRF